MRRHACATATAIATLLIVCTQATAQMTIGTNVLRPEWTSTSNYFKSSVNWATVTDPWNPQFLTELAPYTVIRFMEFNAVYSNTEVAWSDRKLKTASQTQSPIAWEWMIDLCNRTHKDMWVNLPPKSNTDYAYRLAQLINSQLQSDLRIYVEYANETWNSDPYPSAYCQAQGAALGLPGDAATKGYCYHVYAAVRIFEQFERVFGKDSPRLVKTLAGWSGNSIVARTHMRALDDTVLINPMRVKADAYAIAPYMDGATAGAMRATIPSAYASCASHRNAIASHNLKLVLYECGHGQMDALQSVAVDPAVYGTYTAYFDSLSLAVTGAACHFLHVGSGWGALDHTGQALAEAHKYRAIVNWVNGHPVSVVDQGAAPALSVMRDRGSLLQNTVRVFALDGRLVARPAASAEWHGVTVWWDRTPRTHLPPGVVPVSGPER